MDIITLVTLQTADDFIEAGTTISMNEIEATSLIERGFAKRASPQTIKQEVTLQNNQNKDNTENADLAEIIDAISVLDEDGFGKDGRPLVKSLEDILEYDITSDMRDKAWVQYQDNQSDESV